jgi:hypothetical protein
MIAHTLVVWEVEVTDEFIEWWNGLTVDQQESVTDRVDLLAVPLADDLYDTYLAELRHEGLI